MDFSDTLAAASSSPSPKTLLTAFEYFPLFWRELVPFEFANLLFNDCSGDGARIGDAARVAVFGCATLAGEGERARTLFGCILMGDGGDARDGRFCEGDSGGVFGGDADILLVITNGGDFGFLFDCCCCFCGLSIVV